MNSIFNDISGIKVYKSDIKRLADCGLNINVCTIYSAIKQYNLEKREYCDWSLNTISKSLNLSKPTVIQALKKLVENGFLQKFISVDNGVTYTYYLITENLENE